MKTIDILVLTIMLVMTLSLAPLSDRVGNLYDLMKAHDARLKSVGK